MFRLVFLTATLLTVLCGEVGASIGRESFDRNATFRTIAPSYYTVVEELEVPSASGRVSCVVHSGALLEAQSMNVQGFILVKIVRLGMATKSTKHATVCPQGKEFIVPPAHRD